MGTGTCSWHRWHGCGGSVEQRRRLVGAPRRGGADVDLGPRLRPSGTGGAARREHVAGSGAKPDANSAGIALDPLEEAGAAPSAVIRGRPSFDGAADDPLPLEG